MDFNSPRADFARLFAAGSELMTSRQSPAVALVDCRFDDRQERFAFGFLEVVEHDNRTGRQSLIESTEVAPGESRKIAEGLRDRNW